MTAKAQDPGKVEISWRVEVYLHFTGTIGSAEPGSSFDFEMAQVLSMARDNGDYLFADASMPICRGKFRVAGGEGKTWTEKDEAPLEPRVYYMDRENGRCYLPLVVQERSWPKSLPHLVMPRSAEAGFVRDGVSYRRHLVRGDNRIEVVEDRLFDAGVLVMKIDWQWEREQKGVVERHHLSGEFRFIRQEKKLY